MEIACLGTSTSGEYGEMASDAGGSMKFKLLLLCYKVKKVGADKAPHSYGDENAFLLFQVIYQFLIPMFCFICHLKVNNYSDSFTVCPA